MEANVRTSVSKQLEKWDSDWGGLEFFYCYFLYIYEWVIDIIRSWEAH